LRRGKGKRIRKLSRECSNAPGSGVSSLASNQAGSTSRVKFAAYFGLALVRTLACGLIVLLVLAAATQAQEK
jgi:hypothetical protein